MRRTPRAPLAFLTLVLVLPVAGLAQTAEQTGEATEAIENPTIADLAWIAGTWATDLGDQVLEERWSPPMANAMAGSFRWARQNEVWLYEFLLIEQSDNGIYYYLRHFGPGSVGWEERDAPLAYQLETLTPTRAEFDSVDTVGDSFIFSRVEDELTIEIVSSEDVKRFVYTLQAPEATTTAAGADASQDGADSAAETTPEGEPAGQFEAESGAQPEAATPADSE